MQRILAALRRWFFGTARNAGPSKPIVRADAAQEKHAVRNDEVSSIPIVRADAAQEKHAVRNDEVSSIPIVRADAAQEKHAVRNDEVSSKPIVRADAARVKHAVRNDEVLQRIRSIFGTDEPPFAYICGGLRKIAVDPRDRRAQRMLLFKGKRYFSRNQFFVHACTTLLPFDLFLDIGANYGECLFSLPRGSKLRAIGYEANPALVPHLENSREENGDLTGVSIVPAAMSAVAGQTIKFHVNTGASGTSSAVGRSANPASFVTIEVPTTSIDNEIATIGRPVASALFKIDVEGYEPAVFAGAAQALRSMRNVVCLTEFNSVFIERGGVDPARFFADLTRDFMAYRYTNKGFQAVADFADLVRLAGTEGSMKLHVDLVLTRFADDSFAEAFETKIRDTPFRSLARHLGWSARSNDVEGA